MARTPLYDAHVRSGARIVEFAGFEMPVLYTGVTAEAKAVRGVEGASGVGMFDVSHMARLELSGDGATDFLEWVTTNDVAALEPGRGHYSLLPNEAGGVVDDIILYRRGPEAYSMVVNAGNHAKDLAHLALHKPASVVLRDTTPETAMIAVQGPKAAETLGAMAFHGEDLRALPLFGWIETDVAGVPCFAPRSGYTGEDGFELVCAASDADRLWDALLMAGVTPCGLGARDALRVEAGLPLYGHELNDELSPLAAGLGWTIGKEKDFLGADAVDAAREEGTPTRLLGVRMEAKRLLQPGTRVFADGEEVGEVSSGVVAPVLDCGIAFAFVRSDLKPERDVEVEIRGQRVPARLVGKRFLKGRKVSVENF